MIRVLIADDHGIVRSGLTMLIERQADMQVAAEAEDGLEAVERALAERPDVAVLDVSMPRLTGLHAARQIRAHAETCTCSCSPCTRRTATSSMRWRRARPGTCPSAPPTAA